MASKRIRSIPLYIGSKKVAELTQVQYDHNTGQERVITDQGFIGFSEGPDIVDVTFNTVVPIGGHEVDMAAIVLDKKDVAIGLGVDGGIEKVDGRITGRKYSGDNTAGTQTGEWTFMGGKPKRT